MAREPGKWMTDALRKRIKEIVEYHYGFIPEDDDINWISCNAESGARFTYQQFIVNKLAVHHIRASETTEPFHKASDLLIEASQCYVEGLHTACMLVARTAIEVALSHALERVGESPAGLLSQDIDAAHRLGLLDEEGAKMAHEVRVLGNEVAHYDYDKVEQRVAADTYPTIFVGWQPPESERRRHDLDARFDGAASRLAYRSLGFATRVCEQAIPWKPGSM